MKLTFLGAAETVTGSRFLIEKNNKRLLIDCGLFQGLKKLRNKNREEFPVDPQSIDAVILTHAHIDHSGYIPALCNQGYMNNIYCTEASLDLCRILLPDSGHLQEEEAEHANRYGYSRHKPALPLYTEEDAHRSLQHFITLPYDKDFTPVEGFTVRFTNAGHILGSACVHITDGERKIIFSGDVGRPDDPVMQPPDLLEKADYLIIESTYGDRRHNPANPESILEETILETIKKGGTVLIPTFAVGRAQTLLHLMDVLITNKRIPRIPVYLDSPMAINATEIFCRHQKLHSLSTDDCKTMCNRAIYTRTVEESKEIALQAMPKIILSASGMLTGGRVLHHLKNNIENKKNTIIFAGFQAAGTRGATMLSGADRIKIFGDYYPVRVGMVCIDGLSAHADYLEMIQWLSISAINPKKTFIVHGEPQSQDAFRRHLKDHLHWESTIPELGETVELT